MKLNPNGTFRSFDIFMFTLCSTLGIGLGFMPYTGGVEVRSDWLQSIMGALPFFFLIYLIFYFYKKVENANFFEQLQLALPFFLYWLICLYFILSTLLAGVLSLNGFKTIVEVYLLPNTSEWIILITFLLPVGLAVYYNIKTIVRLLVSLFLLELACLVMVFTLGFTEYFRWIYVPPIAQIDFVSFFQALLSDMSRFGGVYTLLAILPFINKKEASFYKSMNLGLGAVVVIYTTLSIVILGVFGYDQSLTLISPIIALTQTFLPGHGIFERLDLLILAFWIITFLKFVTIHIWFIVYIAEKLLPNVKRSIILLLFLVCLLVFTVLTPGYSYLGWSVHNYNALVYTLILPILLLLFLVNRRGKSA